MSEQRVDRLVEHLFRRQAGAMVSALTRIFGRDQLDLIEDVVQDVLIKALEKWPYTGIPERPTAWLVRTAKNRAIDLFRRSNRFAKCQQLLREWEIPESNPERAYSENQIGDDILCMMFMCCHPTLPSSGRTALALKTVAGLSVSEIASAFMTQELTIAQRIVRAKQLIRTERILFELPEREELPFRLDSVLEVLYLWFNAGYLAPEGEQLIRIDVSEEAIRLCRVIVGHEATGLPKCHALLALMLLQAARFPTRIDGEGKLLLLRDQDRSKWDRVKIMQGLHHLGLSAGGKELTSYHVQARIAACHTMAPSYEETDWETILVTGQPEALFSPRR